MARAALLVTALLCGAAGALAQSSSSASKCPITISRLMMPYSHAGGVSTPQVLISFTNNAAKRIARAHFGLEVLDPQGGAHSYEHGLSFTAGVDPGKTAESQWNLDFATVDIHRSGETIYLKSARFDDGTEWKDDGNEKCRFEVNYAPK